MSGDAPRLASLERWFLEVVTHPRGVEAGAATPAALDEQPGGIDAAVAPSAELTAVERVRIYSRMYAWRLVDVLADEFEATRHALGPERFARLARAYVAAHPSTSFTLNDLGAGFPAFLREEAEDVPLRGLVAEVALLERTMEEVFAAPHAEPLASAALEAIPPDAWTGARLDVVPALRLLETRHPVNDYVRAVRAGEEPEIPAPDPRRTVVWRRSWRVWREDLDEARFAVLRALVDGESLGEALAAAAERHPDARPDVGTWFLEWTREGLFARVRL